ncbi:MAG: aminopeptidase P family protein [Solobacterium sp.]|nr:aminopeptidase P family protein [Solobacterium sp.]
MTVNERIEELRLLMKANGIDVYYVPNEDDHLSMEYTADHFKCKSYLTGFSGEAGCAVVTKDFAGLWTDGRFFTQAEKELDGTCVTLMRMFQEGVPNALDYVVDATPEGGVLGFDGSVVSAAQASNLEVKLKAKNASLKSDMDLVGKIWGNERPAMPQEKLYVLAKKYTGEDAGERLERVRETMKKNGADVMVLTALEDPCWVLNIRGNDIECTPVAYAFAMITARAARYYIDAEKVTPAVAKHFEKYGVTVRPYNGLASDLKRLHNKNIWTDLRSLNTVLYAAIADDNTIVNKPLPIEKFRAVKNAAEIRNIRNAHKKDGVAMVRFLRYVKEHVNDGDMTEVSAQNVLYAYRAEGADYIEPSFPTISAYQANGAMMHYCATDESHAALKPEGFLLVDSGGTYKDGTTDITRTIALGKLTDEEKRLYTLVLKGHMALAHAHFLHGTTGNNLDILARQPLWAIDIDYQCGTGHGVGHVLGVHEGPHSIGWGMRRTPAVLEPGMIVTDEPGVYLPHELGIRIENELLVTRGTKNFYGQFLHFEDITYCPYEPEALDLSLLSDEELKWLNDYHANVRETLTPYLEGEDLAFLNKVTQAITR